MAKINRALMKIFGSSHGFQQMGQFGSLAAGSVAYTDDPVAIQSLSNYLTGWYGAVVGDNSPAIQDMNAVCYLYAYQLAYLMQAGIAEYDATTTYYIGSFASDSVGGIFYSKTDTNLGNALTDTTNWQKIGGPSVTQTKSATYTVLVTDGMVRVSGTFTLTMCDATKCAGNEYIVKKTDSNASTVTIAFGGGQTADGASTLSLVEQYSFFRLRSNGTTFDLVGWG